ncbi:TetR/AcrR family transcriptional regulator [Sediminispirochaeta bajacaliforniensis]|uniref:TetR/AcrR family transcriptional regulator n=1 Tax=Sediminispirochaeta bajacaliforniensis TaxID=148 RepID=UPI00036E1064|nr:TetR/AcrR family transcriptional regulator [Sediminispirochaeta bajacaliforniensis]
MKERQEKKQEKAIPRKPKQKRGLRTRQKILDAALVLFCERGYYKTTTNEIAERANVSIGSFYSYFSDKDTIFLEILEAYHRKFVEAKEELLTDRMLIRSDIRQWLRVLIAHLIHVHEETRELNRELTVLSYYNKEVAEILERNMAETMDATIGYFFSVQDDLGISDPQAAAVVVFDMISSTIDRIVFGKNKIDRSRLIDVAVDILSSYLEKRQ